MIVSCLQRRPHVAVTQSFQRIDARQKCGPKIRVQVGGLQGPQGAPGPGAGFLNADSTTITVGGIGAGSSFPVEQSVQQMFDRLLYPYQAPGFTAFGLSGVASPLEVGASFGPNVTFTWSISQSGNVAANSVTISDTTLGTTLATGLANDGSQAVTLAGAVTRTSAGTHGFAIKAENTEDDTFSRGLTIAWQWRRYFGANASPTLTASQILALAGSALATSYGGAYSMGAGGYKFICLADAAGGQITTCKDASTLLNVPMAAGSNTDGGGFGYELVTVTNAQGVATAVRVYRTLNALGSAIDLVVT